MKRAFALLTLAASIAFALSPLFASGFNGFTADQFPVPQNDPPIQPAGWAFSIWLVIYGWLIVSAVYGLLKRDTEPTWTAVRPMLFCSLLVGAAWIPVANVSPFWATVLIWVMWGFAVLALLKTPATDHWWLRAPVALYAGWLTAASCVATAILATGYGAEPVQPIHGLFVVFAASLAGVILRMKPGIPMYALALIWALFGIVVDNLGADRMVFAGVTVVAGLMLLPVAGRNLWSLRRRAAVQTAPAE